jgi:serine/threonine protein kinase
LSDHEGPQVDKDPTSSAAPPDPDGASTLDLRGRRIGSSYLLLNPIGQGATGTVWRGVDQASGEKVAVKLLHESLLRQPKLVTRFVQERTILMMLRHRNVVRVRDLFSVGESLGLVMDLVPGGSLRAYLREHHTLAAGEAARLAAQVAAALAEAHELGVIHRDLKPDNILLCRDQGRLDTRLTDFGIARVLNSPGLTTPNAVVGTPHYMSPEAFHGATASPAADVYALGVLLYEMVCGRPPYESDNVADLMRRHLEGDAERRPGIPDALWDVIRSCMAQKPRLRPSAGELVVELGAVARAAADAPALPRPEPREPEPEEEIAGPSEHPSSVIPMPRRPHRRHNQAPTWRWARPGMTAAIVAGAMLASGVATTAWHVGRSGTDPRPAVAAPPATTTTAATTTTTASARAAPVPSASAGPRAAPQTSAAPSTAGQPAAARTRPGPAQTTTAAPRRKPPVPEAKSYGPWQCRQAIQFSFGTSPLVAGSCASTGARVQMKATVAAASGGSATVSVALQDAATGRTVAGPKTCPGLTYGDQQVARSCGPATVSAPHGRTYVVAISWRYTKDGRTAAGSAKGTPFAF